MNPIYDRKGQVVAWLRNDRDIYQLDGKHAAVIKNGNVYGHRGQHLGIFKKGLFRCHRGGAVAFLKGASGGPMLPLPSISPIPPIPATPPIPAIPSIPPIPAIPSLGWSSTAWGQFISA